MTCDTTTKEKTVYAHWTENPYTIIWKNGYNETPIKTVQNVLYTDIPSTINAQKPGDPTRTGYKFIGWGTPVYDNTNKIVTITAQWEEEKNEPIIGPGPGEDADKTKGKFTVSKSFIGIPDSKKPGSVKLHYQVTYTKDGQVAYTGESGDITLTQANHFQYTLTPSVWRIKDDQGEYTSIPAGFPDTEKARYKTVIVITEYDGEGDVSGYTKSFTATYPADGTNITPNSVKFVLPVDTIKKTLSLKNTYTEQPKISVKKEPEKTEYTEGSDVSWNITVTNNGDNSVSGLNLEDVLKKDGAIFTGTVIVAAPNGLNGTVDSFTLGSKNSVTFKATIEEAEAGTYSNYVAVKKGSEKLGDHTAEDVIVKPDTPSSTTTLTITKQADKEKVYKGDTLVYTITVTNTGANTATNMIITDTLPAGLVLMTDGENGPKLNGNPITSSNGEYMIGDLEAGKTVTLVLTATVTAEPGTEIVNTAMADYDNKPTGETPPKDEEKTDVVEKPEVNVVKTADKEKVVAGDTVVYTITVSNAGKTAAEGVTVEDELDSNLEFISWKLDDGAENTVEPANHVYAIGSIAPESQRRLTITATVKAGTAAGTVIRNTASADYTNKPQTDPGNLESKKDIPVVNEDQYTVKLQYVDDSNPAIILREELIATLENGKPYTIGSDKVLEELTVGENHYVKDGEPSGALTGTINGSDIVVTIPYTLDNKGNDPEKKGDGIPDKYQAVVTYEAVNGTLTGPTEVVITLLDADGNWAENGTAHLTEDEIPAAAPNSGYGNGVWSPATPATDYEIGKDGVHFVITYSPDTPDPTPVDPTPEDPTPAPAAATQAEAETPVAAVEDEEVPLADVSLGPEDETENQAELRQLEDEEVPLAGGGRAWALINFALMNLAIFESLMLLIGYFVKTRNDEDEEEEEKKKLKKKGLFRIISVPVAVISLIAFILTEDITLPTGFVDQYTIVMVIIAVVQTVMVALSNKKYEYDEEEAEA